MKKLFIGCGLLVLLALGFLGYFGYQIWPEMTALFEANERFAQRLETLDQQHPFEPSEQALDTERFATALDLRAEFKSTFNDRLQSFARFEQDGEHQPGFIEVVSEMLRTLRDVTDMVAGFLEQASMGPTEFEYHARLLWATLESIGAGLGGDDVDSLRGAYSELRAAMAELRADHPDLKPLEDIVGQFDTGLLSRAREILATDPQRVLDGIADPFVEVIVYMQLSSLTMEDLMSGHQAGAEAPAAAPDGASDQR